MIKQVMIILFFTLITVYARENPFVSIKNVNKGVINTKTNEPIYLDVVSVPFPDSARKIKKITIEYQHNDGSLGTRVLDMDVAIDWHKPLRFTQKSINHNNTSKSIQKNSSTKIDKTVNSKKSTLNSLVSYKIVDGGFIIYTKNKLLRDFALPNPYKIVLDFKYNSYKKSLEKTINSQFKQLSFGSHRGFFRVVMQLDGRYTYKLFNINNGVKILIK